MNLILFSALFLSDGPRMLGHVTRPDGGFETQIILTNALDHQVTGTLEAYTVDGELIRSVTLSLGSQQARYDRIETLFGSDQVSHIRIMGDSGLAVTAAYTSDSGGSPAHVQASPETSTRWVVLPGDWTQVWDGLAVINSGDQNTDVTIELVYKTSDVFETKVLENVAPMEKRLLVFSDEFPEILESRFQLSAPQPLSVVALRGSQGTSQTPYLWENVAIDVSLDQVTDTGFDFASRAPWFPCPELTELSGATFVTIADDVFHFFGEENRRELIHTASMPVGSYRQIGLWLQLDCPQSGLCDHWDRSGSLELVLNPEQDPSEWRYLELTRFITPYRTTMCQFIDLTSVASLLSGELVFRSWIDTWVGPGHASGDGWNLTLRGVFLPGPRPPAPEVVNVWGRRSLIVGQRAEGETVEEQTEPFSFYVGEDVTRVEAHLIATGHSFGNTMNCAEFCEMKQNVLVNGSTFSVLNWRGDCESNPVSPQSGTWRFDRNGWCPGAIVPGQVIDISQAVQYGSNNTLDFDVRLLNDEIYENLNPVDLLPSQWLSLKLYLYR